MNGLWISWDSKQEFRAQQNAWSACGTVSSPIFDSQSLHLCLQPTEAGYPWGIPRLEGEVPGSQGEKGENRVWLWDYRGRPRDVINIC